MEMFMIVPPLSPMDKPAEELLIRASHPTLGTTAGEAWRKYTRGDMSKVQHWHDRGYRVRRVDVQLIEEAA